MQLSRLLLRNLALYLMNIFHSNLLSKVYYFWHDICWHCMYEWCPTYCSLESNITVASSVAWLELSRNLFSKTVHNMEAFFLYPLKKFESFKYGVIIETTLLINLVIICSSLILDVSTNNVWCIVQMEPHRTWVSLKYMKNWLQAPDWDWWPHCIVWSQPLKSLYTILALITT